MGGKSALPATEVPLPAWKPFSAVIFLGSRCVPESVFCCGGRCPACVGKTKTSSGRQPLPSRFINVAKARWLCSWSPFHRKDAATEASLLCLSWQCSWLSALPPRRQALGYNYKEEAEGKRPSLPPVFVCFAPFPCSCGLKEDRPRRGCATCGPPPLPPFQVLMPETDCEWVLGFHPPLVKNVLASPAFVSMRVQV